MFENVNLSRKCINEVIRFCHLVYFEELISTKEVKRYSTLIFMIESGVNIIPDEKDNEIIIISDDTVFKISVIS